MRKEQLETVNFFGLYTWLGLISISLSLYFFYPEFFTPGYIRQFFSENLLPGLILYFVISTLRGFTLIPSTPIVFAGILVFPPLPLFLVNQAAVYSSSAIVYLMARHFRFDHFFSAHYPGQIRTLTRLLHRRELPVISLWGFAPFVPSDMIVYVCSILRLSIWKTLLGISIGEGAICALYIFGGYQGLTLLQTLQQGL
ncbi:MAG: VTT domain-containing protein [Pseudomonadales bacterium]|nr:VTT domain-containing protein [Pseudomonadales bacterium]